MNGLSQTFPRLAVLEREEQGGRGQTCCQVIVEVGDLVDYLPQPAKRLEHSDKAIRWPIAVAKDPRTIASQ